MQRSVAIASKYYDPSMTDAMLEHFPKTDPAQLLVFSTFGDDTKSVGKVLRLWRQGQEVWAELDVPVASHWPLLEPDIHVESIVTFKDAEPPNLIGVVITSMPRGELGRLFAQHFEHLKSRN